MSGVGQVARKGQKRGVYGFLSGNLRERGHLEKLTVDVRIILIVASGNRVRERTLG
jgi:hypothetical protein